jgi:hypothetical protein
MPWGLSSVTMAGQSMSLSTFPREVKEKLTYDDKIIIHAKGQGAAKK